MFKFTLLFCSLFLVLTSIYFIPWFSIKTESQSINTLIVEDESKTNISGNKIYGSIYPLKYNGEDLRTFTLSQPLPEIWLATAENEEPNLSNDSKIEISSDAKKILYQHWIKVLEFRYITEIEDFSKNINYSKEDIKLFNSTIETENLLLEISIDGESGSRNFSANEANQIAILLRDKADEVIKGIKQIPRYEND